MSAQASSIGSLLSALLLSDHRLLQLAWEKPFTSRLGWADLREPTYLAYQPWAARFPDHVFDSAWRYLASRQLPGQEVLLAATQALIDEFLEVPHDEIRVRQDLLGAWQQGLASRVSSVPIRAAANVAFRLGRGASGEPFRVGPSLLDRKAAPWRHRVLPLLRTEEATVAEYVEREGLHETHLHLNGSTHAEICWLRAIRDPRAEARQFVAAWTRGPHAGPLRELVGQVNPHLTPQSFYQHLLTAGRLRAWLAGAAADQILSNAALPVSCHSLCSAASDEWSVGLREQATILQPAANVGEELAWMTDLFERLRRRPSVQLAHMFHTYLLLLNEHYRLLVQSEAQYGFDQFQKFTLTELREPAEREYRTRFFAMHGPRPAISTIEYLEGRFAPKDSPLKLCRLLQAVLGGYLGYLLEAAGVERQPVTTPRSLSALLADLERYFDQPTIRRRSIQRLALVAHFIKHPWPPAQMHKAGPYRHYPLDLQLRRAAGVLLTVLARWPRLKTWVRGIDAAANELHAPPDVFAPVFRVCFRAGLTRRTYHAGEDFRHLLSGIATMWEALTLLDLRGGDRIGHGTAMGIRPKLWLDRMPRTLTLSLGEWMQGVLAAWQLLRDVPEMQACAHRLQRELEEVAHEIFGRYLAAGDVERAMALRGLNRSDLMRQQSGEADSHFESLSEPWRDEAELVRSIFQNEPQAIGLLWEWLSDKEVLGRAEELIAKEAGFLDALSYLKLQQALMRHVANRGVLVETLPSSNVRISQYHHVDEHHSLRWMRVPGHTEDGDPEIKVCLGSDDPGIFAGDLETEFYLLHAAMRRAGLGDSETMSRLSVLNERGRTYRFHHQQLS